MVQNVPKTNLGCIKCQFAAIHAVFYPFKVLQNLKPPNSPSAVFSPE